jgi:hypothetical protein
MNYGMYFGNELQKSAAGGSVLIGGLGAAGASAIANEIYGDPSYTGSSRITTPLVYGAIGGLTASPLFNAPGKMKYLFPASIGAGAAAMGTGKLLGADQDMQRRLMGAGSLGTIGGMAAHHLRGGIPATLLGTGIGAGLGALIG